MKPTQAIIDKAISQVKTGFTKEIMPMTKLNKKSFVVSVINIRGGQSHLIDYTFNTKTGRLQYTKVVESKYL